MKIDGWYILWLFLGILVGRLIVDIAKWAFQRVAGGQWLMRFEFKAADCWFGFYPRRGWDGPYRTIDVWICVIPMFPLHIRWEKAEGPAWGPREWPK